MVNEYIRYRVPEARAAAFVASYETACQSLRASPHCLGYDLSRCEEAPDQFILLIHWDSTEGHLKGFRGGPHFGAFLQAIKPYIGDIEEMRHYQPTQLKWSR